MAFKVTYRQTAAREGMPSDKQIDADIYTQLVAEIRGSATTSTVIGGTLSFGDATVTRSVS